jgi:dienelactone hydrolase
MGDAKLCYLGMIVGCLFAAAPSRGAETGTVHFTPGDQAKVPERYRLEERVFRFELERKGELPASELSIYKLRFPSPVKSATPENNTVHAEYYRPHGTGPFPGVIVLDITGGNQQLSRTFALYLAQHKVAGLFVQMAYYGPRRPPGSKLRLLSPDIPHTVEAVRQTVLDLRYAAAWLESRPEINPKQIGIMGTSLGSFLAALTSEMEPRLGRVAVLLGGGGFVEAYYDHPLAAWWRAAFVALGGSRERLKELIAPIDPLTCAENLKDRKLLILAARQDEIVPAKMAEMLWQASGKQKIIWFDAGHYTAIKYITDAMREIVAHFSNPD